MCLQQALLFVQDTKQTSLHSSYPFLLQAKEKGKAPVSADTAEAYTTATAAAVADDNPVDRDWADLYEDYVDAELEEDEEIENYYFSSAAGEGCYSRRFVEMDS